ncbi:hypothetical protein [Bradyrhizobium sp. SRS-191]|uniref:hypothetical protein n=1 Tax=Bradyrhizobium sp. SRS-191 TaxID=2962606 RepID=UPI00211EF8C0|nr:hypothetical protein [Bradyrhizobium sp. SRS-191]
MMTPREQLRLTIATALVDVTNTWIRPNFPPDLHLRGFDELDEQEQALNLAYADAAIRAVENAHAQLIATYFRREIGSLMQQAEHWAANGKPFAAHHRVTKADNYYQVVALFERHGLWNENTFDNIAADLARPDIKPPGAYPPAPALDRYRDPAYATAMATGEQPVPVLRDVYVPGAWRCPKCNFGLQQATLNAADGSVSSRDTAGDTCPNCAKPLWRVTWKEQAEALALRCEELVTAKGSAVVELSPAPTITSEPS